MISDPAHAAAEALVSFHSAPVHQYRPPNPMMNEHLSKVGPVVGNTFAERGETNPGPLLTSASRPTQGTLDVVSNHASSAPPTSNANSKSDNKIPRTSSAATPNPPRQPRGPISVRKASVQGPQRHNGNFPVTDKPMDWRYEFPAQVTSQPELNPGKSFDQSHSHNLRQDLMAVDGSNDLEAFQLAAHDQQLVHKQRLQREEATGTKSGGRETEGIPRVAAAAEGTYGASDGTAQEPGSHVAVFNGQLRPPAGSRKQHAAMYSVRRRHPVKLKPLAPEAAMMEGGKDGSSDITGNSAERASGARKPVPLPSIRSILTPRVVVRRVAAAPPGSARGVYPGHPNMHQHVYPHPPQRVPSRSVVMTPNGPVLIQGRAPQRMPVMYREEAPVSMESESPTSPTGGTVDNPYAPSMPIHRSYLPPSAPQVLGSPSEEPRSVFVRGGAAGYRPVPPHATHHLPASYPNVVPGPPVYYSVPPPGYPPGAHLPISMPRYTRSAPTSACTDPAFHSGAEHRTLPQQVAPSSLQHIPFAGNPMDDMLQQKNHHIHHLHTQNIMLQRQLASIQSRDSQSSRSSNGEGDALHSGESRPVSTTSEKTSLVVQKSIGDADKMDEVATRSVSPASQASPSAVSPMSKLTLATPPTTRRSSFKPRVTPSPPLIQHIPHFRRPCTPCPQHNHHHHMHQQPLAPHYKHAHPRERNLGASAPAPPHRRKPYSVAVVYTTGSHPAQQSRANERSMRISSHSSTSPAQDRTPKLMEMPSSSNASHQVPLHISSGPATPFNTMSPEAHLLPSPASSCSPPSPREGLDTPSFTPQIEAEQGTSFNEEPRTSTAQESAPGHTKQTLEKLGQFLHHRRVSISSLTSPHLIEPIEVSDGTGQHTSEYGSTAA
ncbi:hypothetical protein DFS34DRAFT_648550 [Phlyctochytrium arcticum]|nr:hypothetical protein DFS34DRAFT_648550 [Phlyctochytrium arcticum]